ncbi:type II toxin-antitoxin system HicB family antitoxin [Qipengyuania sp. S6317L1]|uniref:type II toxin-antitoxin system HicB family antitoxin n=1 Tax=Qipengyuania sp. S6317L1 TaxID=2926410 RepID=UPI001FF4C651|nr:type II toxin-antitoxin system HicB family antitoxin [Qipengyuania sp. S6317L1]MCK0099835.1 type II toxin-antitoxin system HicB family antitoxin [Qipengyuania sp. S6317L1]
MSDASFASLGPTLLARKGGAKPAMRPQVAPLPGVVVSSEDQLEDLGWNDMGDANDTQTGDQTGSDSPVVREQQDRLAKRIAAGEADAVLPQPVAKIPSRKKLKAQKKSVSKATAATPKTLKRAAFTLRLDPERHLKLRLAATINGKSAQALLTEALDAMLSEIADLDALARRVKPTMTQEG